jgi:NAD-dependent dihydropyrimidine dehydrogenase PreA subunit
MIEFVSETRCTQCNLCVRTCPAKVFDAVPGAAPVIARQKDCLTCYVCELHCPVDALYVAPDADLFTMADHDLVEGQGVLDDYRQTVGWANVAGSRSAAEPSFKFPPRGDRVKPVIASGKGRQNIVRRGKSPRGPSGGG